MSAPELFDGWESLLDAANNRTCDGVDDDPEPVGWIQRDDTAGGWITLDAAGFMQESTVELETDRQFDTLATAYNAEAAE